VATSYGYDNIYQLPLRYARRDGHEGYPTIPVWQPLSDLTTSGWSNNNFNELTSRPGVSYTFDNMERADQGVGSDTTSYTWDYENRLTSVTLAEPAHRAVFLTIIRRRSRSPPAQPLRLSLRRRQPR